VTRYGCGTLLIWALAAAGCLATYWLLWRLVTAL
jgi:hypothetical protein